jgi:hypothetical protein
VQIIEVYTNTDREVYRFKESKGHKLTINWGGPCEGKLHYMVYDNGAIVGLFPEARLEAITIREEKERAIRGE